jgi:glycerophosphoryl diester phosphodiesterase
MNYEQIKQYDCGSKVHPRFLEQQKIKTYKPLLSEVIDSVEHYIKIKHPGKKIYYNIETKTTIEGDGIFHPKTEDFVHLMVKVIKEKQIDDRVYIQSFDVRTLGFLHKEYPEFKTVLLVENEFSIDENLKLLGFKPDVYSPYFKLLDKKKVNYLHQKKIKVIPWTVNDKKDMQQIIKMKVDGIISDYPNRYFELH